ncbi:nuclear transport factor 2 family protein [Microbacterium sp. USTB-Y]|uniref:nuclear transport factor 2 family protein n=1 Tax=Microbacterium sp. USTB-Y TaxID=2823692 RepID=UPI002041C383|nr:nuclear transport factor 2 family protein [Microbacterium sp. USTB-Y]
MSPQTNLPTPVEMWPPASGSALEHVRRLEGHVPSVVTDALHAANSQDADALTRCFHPDADVDAWGMLFEGFQGITLWIEKWIIENRVQFTDLLHAWDGSDLAVHTQVHGDSYNGPATLTFSTVGDTISALRITTA